jgi:hypothetical protein
LLAGLPHNIDPNSPAFQADLAKVDRIAEQEKARDTLGMNDDLDVYWQIPRQAAIECRPLGKGNVEIWQEGQHGDEDASVFNIAAGNAVQFARSVLYAAGFRRIGIYTYEHGGNVDVEDGHLASNFYDGKPGYGPVR